MSLEIGLPGIVPVVRLAAIALALPGHLRLLRAASALALIDALLDILSDGALIGAGSLSRCLDVIHRDVALVPLLIIDLAAATTDTHGNGVLLSGNW